MQLISKFKNLQMRDLYLGEQKCHITYISEKSFYLKEKQLKECFGLLKQKSEQHNSKISEAHNAVSR